jgi:hypothetical protein
MPGCNNPPAWLDQSNIPEFVTYTLPDSDCSCFAGKKITLQYDRCMSIYSQGILMFYYIYRGDLGTCDSYTYRASLFLRIYGPPYTEGIPSTAYQTRLDIRDYNNGVYGTTYCLYEPDPVLWPGSTASVTEAIATLPEIESGDVGGPSGCWCNGYGNGSIAFGITKQHQYSAETYGPANCCSDKRATDIICSASLSDFVFTWSGWTVTAYLSTLNLITLTWRIYNSGICYGYAYGINFYIPTLREKEGLDPVSSDSEFLLYIRWACETNPCSISNRMHIQRPGYYETQYPVGTLSPSLTDCDYDGNIGTIPSGSLQVESANYCYAPWE